MNDIGFLVITGHDVDPALITQVQTVSNRFFGLPIAEKQRVARPSPSEGVLIFPAT